MISDPILGEMNDTRWLFEYESMRKSEDDRRDEIKQLFDAFKMTFIELCGLDLMPITDEETGILRRQNSLDGEFTPMAIMMGRREWTELISEKITQLQEQEKLEEDLGQPPAGMINTLEELEELERQEVLDGDGDIEFDDPKDLEKFLIWNSKESKYIREHEIITVHDELDSKGEPEPGPEPEDISDDERPDRTMGSRFSIDE